MIIIIYVVASMMIFAGSMDAQRSDYCDMRSCRSPRSHTLCRNNLREVNNSCGMVFTTNLTRFEIQELLDIHRTLRAKVASGKEFRGRPGPQPAARNMRHLMWSNELAAIAQTWANQCNFNHDDCRDTDNFRVGQNLGYRASTSRLRRLTLTQVVMDWYDEVALVDRNIVNSYVHSAATGHYTQMVWANTRYLGCGAVRHNPDNRWFRTYLVCNYGPAGNFIGQPIYQT